MERVTKAEESEVNRILERKLQEIRLGVAQEKAEHLKQKAIEESDAQFV